MSAPVPAPAAPGPARPGVVAQAAADGAPEAGSAVLGGIDVEKEAKEIEEQIKVLYCTAIAQHCFVAAGGPRKTKGQITVL